MFENAQIERGVPMPQSRKKLNEKPWCDMQPGDSVFIAAFDPQNGRQLNPHEAMRLRKALMHVGHKYWGAGGYSVLAASKDGVEGFRVWRRK